MIAATDILDGLHDGGIDFVSGTPCSYLKPLINAAAADSRFRFVDAVNEGDAVALASGAILGGKRAAVMFQNSGLGNAVNALTSLCEPFRVPVLLIVTHRGEPGGDPDEPQHALMGEITTRMLETMGIPWERLPSDRDTLAAVLDRADEHMAASQSPYALVVSKGTVAPHPLAPQEDLPPIGERRIEFLERISQRDDQRPTRTQALGWVRAARRDSEVLIATTGYTGRELAALADDPWQLYIVGSMGSASALGLGLAITLPERPVTVIDGDGALLMRMGNMAMIGAKAGANFTHIVLDNEAHDSTGGQGTISRQISFGAIAKACGYRRVFSLDDPDGFRAALAERREGPTLVHLRIKPGAPEELPRPDQKPATVFRRLQNWLAS
jgi:phosphonopyruvate decarboxylase